MNYRRDQLTKIEGNKSLFHKEEYLFEDLNFISPHLKVETNCFFVNVEITEKFLD